MERVGRAIRQLPDCKGSSERTRAVGEFQFRDPMTPVSLAISSASSPPAKLFQSKRLDCWLVNCSGNRQALVALVIRQSRSSLDVQRTRYCLGVITCLLQGHLNIRDRFIG